MLLLRHGQSYFNLHFNATRVDPGIEDPELTPLGFEQAAAAAARLSARVLTHVIISPYTRALQTAQPVLAVHQVPVAIMQEVREQAAYACDIGSPPDVLASRFPHHDFRHLPAQFSSVKATTTEALARRYLDPASMVIIAVGSRATLEAALSKLGVGPIEVWPIAGTLF